jgi:hypothetical protein
MNPEDSHKFIRLSIWVERFWLLAFAVGTAYSGYHLYTGGWEQERTTLVLPAIAGVWWYFRRSFRKRLARTQTSQDA